MRGRLGFVIVLLSVIGLAVGVSAAAGGRGKAPSPGHVRLQFVDYSHGTPGPPSATDAATAYKVTVHPYVLRLESDLTYTISATGCSPDCGSATSAAEAGLGAWQVSGLTLSAAANPATADTNPCTGQANSVTWQPIGAANVLAETLPCQDTSNGQIDGFDIVFNSNADWSDCSSVSGCGSASSGDYSIAAVAAHEGGHVYGLGHDHAAKDSRLTMFFATGPNDYGHATLGCGDRLGVNALYGTSLDCNSLPGD